jgi:multiple sugar transport system permease protein
MTVAPLIPVSAPRPPSGGRGRTSVARRKRVGRVFGRVAPLGPAVIVLLLLFAGPILWSIYTAFTDLALSGQQHASFVGTANFRRLFHDQTFLRSLWLTLLFVVGSAVIGQNLLGLLLAFVMREAGRPLRFLVGTLVLSAWVVPELVAAFCWYAFLNTGGTLNSILGTLGISQDWLYTSPMLAVILANVWRGTAFSMMVYQAALSDIPPELTEAAQVDGASAFQRLRFVSLPLIRRAILSNLMLITLQTLAVFGLIFVMTAGGPGDKSATTPVYMYEQAFKFYQLGYGTAMALVLLLVGAVFSVGYLRLLRAEEL